VQPRSRVVEPGLFRVQGRGQMPKGQNDGVSRQGCLAREFQGETGAGAGQ